MKHNAVDMTGKHIGYVTVLEYAGTSSNRGRCALWLVRCDCGREFVTRGTDLRSGVTRACREAGCLNHPARKHGGAGSREYIAWTAMKSRCLNPKRKDYPRYGGRGIKVCERWIDSFEAFLADVGPKPSPAHSLDRIDNSGHYEPGNVRWTTRSVQGRNRRANVEVTWNGATRTLIEWSEILEIPYFRLAARKRLGWTPEQMLTTAKYDAPLGH